LTLNINEAVKILILQSKSEYSKLLELNSADGTYRETQKNAVDGTFPKIKINGVFDFLNGALVALYACSGHIILRIGNTVIRLDKGVEVVVSGEKSNRFLRLNQNGIEVACLRYSIADAPIFVDDPTPFVANEDSDFGLFVANIASSADRRSVALENWLS
jgi:hypothetical protein